MFTFTQLLISVGSKLIDSLSKKSPRRHSENFADSTPQFKNQHGVLFKNSMRMFQFLCLTSLALSVSIFLSYIFDLMAKYNSRHVQP